MKQSDRQAHRLEAADFPRRQVGAPLKRAREWADPSWRSRFPPPSGGGSIEATRRSTLPVPTVDISPAVRWGLH